MHAHTVTARAGANAALQDFVKASLHSAAPQECELEDAVPGSQPGIMRQGPGIVIECWGTAGRPSETLKSLQVTFCTILSDLHRRQTHMSGWKAKLYFWSAAAGIAAIT